MSDIKKLTEKIIKFRNERNWIQFHNPKDVSLSLVLEAAEVMEHFQWKNEKEIKKYIKTNINLIPGDKYARRLFCQRYCSSRAGQEKH